MRLRAKSTTSRSRTPAANHHERTDEFYSSSPATGTMVLDDEGELHEGVVVYVPRGVRHKAKGKLTVLTVCVPAVCWATFTRWSNNGRIGCQETRRQRAVSHTPW